MAQNLNTEDLRREVNIALSTGTAFCGSHKGMTYCDRHDGHNGKHAAAVNGYWNTETQRLEYAKVVRW